LPFTSFQKKLYYINSGLEFSKNNPRSNTERETPAFKSSNSDYSEIDNSAEPPQEISDQNSNINPEYLESPESPQSGSNSNQKSKPKLDPDQKPKPDSSFDLNLDIDKTEIDSKTLDQKSNLDFINKPENNNEKENNFSNDLEPNKNRSTETTRDNLSKNLSVNLPKDFKNYQDYFRFYYLFGVVFLIFYKLLLKKEYPNYLLIAGLYQEFAEYRYNQLHNRFKKLVYLQSKTNLKKLLTPQAFLEDSTTFGLLRKNDLISDFKIFVKNYDYIKWSDKPKTAASLEFDDVYKRICKKIRKIPPAF